MTSAWKALREKGSAGWQQRLAMSALTTRTTPADIPSLLAATPSSDSFARTLLLRRWTEVDPAAAGAWAAAFLEGKSSDQRQMPEVEQLLGFLAAEDPKGTAALIRKSADPEQAANISHDVLLRLLPQDPVAWAAFGVLTPLSKNHGSWNLISQQETEWLTKNPQQATEFLASLPPGNFRDRQMCNALTILSSRNFPAALSLYLKHPELSPRPFVEDFRPALFKAWGQKDLDGLTRHLDEIKSGVARTAVLEAIGQTLGEQNPLTALPWVTENLSGTHREVTVEKILTQLTKSDPNTARNILASLPDGSVTEKAVAGFVGGLTDHSHSALFAHMEQLPAGPARQQLAGQAHAAWIWEDPRAALQSLARYDRKEVPEGLWRELGSTPGLPARALGYLSEVPPAAAAEFVAGQWRGNVMHLPTSQFTPYLDALPDKAMRAAALETAASSHQYPELVAWATTLPDPQERQFLADQIRRTLRHFPTKDLDQLLAPLK